MIKNVLNGIEGVDVYPIISLFIFVPFFLGLIWWVIKVDKNYIDKLKNLPLDSTDKK
jgi:cytochrome c oxidase cbb3-type subunit IV